MKTPCRCVLTIFQRQKKLARWWKIEPNQTECNASAGHGNFNIMKVFMRQCLRSMTRSSTLLNLMISRFLVSGICTAMTSNNIQTSGTRSHLIHRMFHTIHPAVRMFGILHITLIHGHQKHT